MKMVSNSKDWHRMWSNRAALLSALVGIQELLPVWKGIIPDNVFSISSALIATSVVILRLMDQGLTNAE